MLSKVVTVLVTEPTQMNIVSPPPLYFLSLALALRLQWPNAFCTVAKPFSSWHLKAVLQHTQKETFRGAASPSLRRGSAAAWRRAHLKLIVPKPQDRQIHVCVPTSGLAHLLALVILITVWIYCINFYVRVYISIDSMYLGMQSSRGMARHRMLRTVFLTTLAAPEQQTVCSEGVPDCRNERLDPSGRVLELTGLL